MFGDCGFGFSPPGSVVHPYAFRLYSQPTPRAAGAWPGYAHFYARTGRANRDGDAGRRYAYRDPGANPYPVDPNSATYQHADSDSSDRYPLANPYRSPGHPNQHPHRNGTAYKYTNRDRHYKRYSHGCGQCYGHCCRHWDGHGPGGQRHSYGPGRQRYGHSSGWSQRHGYRCRQRYGHGPGRHCHRRTYHRTHHRTYHRTYCRTYHRTHHRTYH